MGYRADIDWEKAEKLFRLGKASNADIARECGITRQSLIKKAKREGWEKDLTEAVSLETKLQVRKSIVKEATEKLHKELHSDVIKDLTDVKAEAISNALMIAEHEKAGTKGRKVLEGVLDQIGKQVEETPAIKDLLEMASNSEDLEGLVAGMRKVLSLPSYVDSAKKAMEGIAKAIEVERKARNLDDKSVSDNKSIEEKLDEIREQL